LKNGQPFNFEEGVTSDIALTAKWLSTSGFTVSIFRKWRNWISADRFFYLCRRSETATVLPASNLTGPSDKPSFLGWNTNKEGTGTMYQPGSTVTINGANVTLYAIWGASAATTSLTYKANGGEGDDDTVSNLKNNEQVTLKDASTFTRTGYTLSGWATTATATIAEFACGSDVRVDNIGSNILYAVWTKRTDLSYSVKYYYDNVLDETKTDNFSGKTFGEEISTYTAKLIDGYVLDHATAPITIGTDSTKNVISVY
jgi:hypothetical protein